MIWHGQISQVRRLVMGIGVLIGLITMARSALAQGCMPLHFAFPGSVGGQVNYFQAHDWQLGVSFRRVAANRFFLGSQENETLAPILPLHLRSYGFDLSLSYATSERLSFALTVPLSYNSDEHTHADGLRHKGSSSGLGDINLFGNLWLAAPGKHPNGNLSVGLGIKAPTGSYHATAASFDSAGNSTQQLLQQTTQLGNGGWAVLLQTQAFHSLFSRTSAYLSGSYSISLKQHTDVVHAPGGFWAVPDEYSARLGVAYTLVADPAISLSLGGRIDGTTLKDIVGGRTDYFRHGGYTEFIEPGLALLTGPSQFTLSVPVRVHHKYLDQTLSDGSVRPGIGGVGDYVIYAGYTRRF